MAFRKIDEEGTLPGPRALFICGYDNETHRAMDGYLKEMGIEGVEVIPCRTDSLEKTVGEVLKGVSTAEPVDAEKLPPVMVWAGLGHKELDTALADFGKTGVKRPIFATATEPNLKFTVKELLQHLISEQRAMREAMNKES